MIDDKLLLIGIGIAIAVIAALVAILLIPRCDPPQPPSSGDYYYGLAEASGPDAEEKAIDEARAKMVEMASVEVVVESILEKNSSVLCGAEGCDKRELERFEKEIKTRAGMEISGYEQEIKRCGDKVYALTYIPKTKADLYFKAMSLKALLDNALESRMFYTAKGILEDLESYSDFFNPLPSFLRDLPRIRSELLERLERIESIVSRINGITGSSPDDGLRALSLYRDLLSLTPEIPQSVSERVKDITKKSGVVVEIHGPFEVVRTQVVRLEIEVPGAVGVYRFDVNSYGGNFPKEVTVEGGRGVLEGVVVGDVRVELSLTDVLKSEWSPGSVLEPTVENTVKVLLANVEKPRCEVVFLPSEPSPYDAAAAIDAEKVAKSLGWRFAPHERLIEEFNDMVSNWVKEWDVDRIPAIFVKVEENGLGIEGAVKGYVRANVEPKSATDEDIRKLLMAAISSGNAQLALRSEGFIKGVALYSLGRLEDAAKVFQKLEDPLSKLALSRVLYDMGDYSGAINAAVEVMDEYPNQSLTLIALSLAHLPPESVFIHPEYQDYIFRAVHTVRDNHAAYYAASVLLRKLGNCEEAEEWIVKALDFKKSPDYLMEYARVLKCLGKKGEAKEVLKELLKMKDLKFSVRKEAEEMMKGLEK